MANHRTAALVVPSVMALGAIAAVALRLAARRMKSVRLGLDDYTITTALVRLHG